MHGTRGRVNAGTRSERRKLYFNKHFFILYVYDHLEIYAWILKENLSQ